MTKKTISFFVLLIFSLPVLCQTPMVHYKSSKHYNHRVRYFQRQPMINKDDIVMFGNSLIEFGGDWNKLLPQSKDYIVNRGIMGDDAEGMMHRLNQITASQPKKIFVDCGINDVSHHLSNEEVESLVQKLLAEIKLQCPHSEIYYFSLLPINESFKRWRSLDGRTDDIPIINDAMEKWCEAHDITYIDLFSLMKEDDSNVLRSELTVDGLHLTKSGYDIWANKLREFIVITD